MDLTTGCFSEVLADSAAGGGAVGSLPAEARSRSSGVFAHRQFKSFLKLPVKPPVRTVVHTPQASRTVATIVARRRLVERRRLAAAQTTRAKLSSGVARMASNSPCAPVAIDRPTSREVANSATTINTTGSRNARTWAPG